MKAKLKVAALLTSAALHGGCASTGPHAPTNARESASGAAGAALGAVATGAVGATVGVFAGFATCGPGFIICSPVMALVLGVAGAAKGGEYGAKAGVGLSRTRPAPESAAKVSEPAAPPPIEPSALADALAEAASKG